VLERRNLEDASGGSRVVEHVGGQNGGFFCGVGIGGYFDGVAIRTTSRARHPFPVFDFAATFGV